jgi:hypothetical protein
MQSPLIEVFPFFTYPHSRYHYDHVISLSLLS